MATMDAPVSPSRKQRPSQSLGPQLIPVATPGTETRAAQALASRRAYRAGLKTNPEGPILSSGVASTISIPSRLAAFGEQGAGPGSGQQGKRRPLVRIQKMRYAPHHGMRQSPAGHQERRQVPTGHQERRRLPVQYQKMGLESVGHLEVNRVKLGHLSQDWVAWQL